MEKTGAEVEAKVADVTDSADIRDLVDFTVRRFGGLHILITNAGGPSPGRFEEFADGDWLEAWNLNAMSAVRLIRESLPHLRKTGCPGKRYSRRWQRRSRREESGGLLGFLMLSGYGEPGGVESLAPEPQVYSGAAVGYAHVGVFHLPAYQVEPCLS